MLVAGLLIGQSQAQTKVSTADFARRPQFYQGKTILLSNVSVNIGEVNHSNNHNNVKGRPRPTPPQQSHNEKNWGLALGTPRCKPLMGWNLIQPDIPNLNAPLCFAVMSKIYDRLPQNKTFNADILVEIDVRGICKIKRIRVLR